MAGLTRNHTGGAGLGTFAARCALVVVLILVAASTVIDGSLSLMLPQPMQIAAFALTLVGAMVLTTPGDGELPPARAVVVPACAVIAGAFTLSAWDAAGEVWLFNITVYLVALLIARGNLSAGVAGGAILIALGLGAGRYSGASQQAVAALLGTPVMALCVGVIWFLLLRRIVAHERSHRTEIARAALAADVAREATAANARELGEIVARVRPVLESIIAGHPLDQETHRRLTMLEAGIRDRIRSPGLQHPILVEAITACRERGARVLLLGDGARPCSQALAEAVASFLAPAGDEQITLRALPAGRHGALSLLIVGPDDATRVVFAEDGSVIGMEE